jgi:hypothetical protein
MGGFEHKSLYYVLISCGVWLSLIEIVNSNWTDDYMNYIVGSLYIIINMTRANLQEKYNNS